MAKGLRRSVGRLCQWNFKATHSTPLSSYLRFAPPFPTPPRPLTPTPPQPGQAQRQEQPRRVFFGRVRGVLHLHPRPHIPPPSSCIHFDPPASTPKPPKPNPKPTPPAPAQERTMRLSPRELDKLRLHQAGYLAQKRLARGQPLNHPESVALIATVLMELIRDGTHSCAQLMDLGRWVGGWMKGKHCPDRNSPDGVDTGRHPLLRPTHGPR